VRKVVGFSEKSHLDVITVDTLMNSSKLDFDSVYSILHDEVFPMLGLDFKQKQTKNGQYSQEYIYYSKNLQAFLDTMLDVSVLFESGPNFNVKPVIKLTDYFSALHNFYFGQLRVESQEDPMLETLLWKEMASVNEDEVPRFVEKLLRANHPEITKDMGQISLKAGIIIQKKFKFYGEKGQQIQVYSD